MTNSNFVTLGLIKPDASTELAYWIAELANSVNKAARCKRIDDPQGEAFYISKARLAAEQLEEAGIPVLERLEIDRGVFLS